jgi:anti-sigma factor ChrR (cupin superfamily)
LPSGAQIVVLDGDPAKPGPFTIRLKIPAGYQIPPHTHPAAAERITVISGAVRLGIGEKFDASGGRELQAGGFAVVPAGVPHSRLLRATPFCRSTAKDRSSGSSSIPRMIRHIAKHR